MQDSQRCQGGLQDANAACAYELLGGWLGSSGVAWGATGLLQPGRLDPHTHTQGPPRCRVVWRAGSL